MASPVPDSYSCASGGAIYAGRTAPLPAWVPAAGTFANISLNTLYDVRPSGWPTNDIAGPFLNWAGGVYASDFSTLGALVIRGSGHLSGGSPTWAGNWAFDLDTLQWIGRNVPGAPLLEYPPNSAQYNGYYESLDAASLGHPYPPHTYDGLVYRSAAQGGGTKGALVANFSPGTGGVTNFVHQYDLSSGTAAPTRVINDLPLSGASGNYPMTAVDSARGGYWILPNNGTAPLKFVRFSDWAVTTYTGVGYATYGDNSLIYVPAPYDCLVGMGRANAEGTLFNVYVCPIVANVPQGFTQVTTSGTPPADGRCGGVWSTRLSRIVSYEGNRSTNVHKLAPPSGSLTAGTWAWTTESMTGVGGILPSNPGINTNNGQYYTENGAWSRFVEVPAARCFIWANGVTAPVQAWRLTGM